MGPSSEVHIGPISPESVGIVVFFTSALDLISFKPVPAIVRQTIGGIKSILQFTMLKLNTASVSQEELSRHYYSGSLTYARKRSEQIAIDDKTSLQSPEYSVGQLYLRGPDKPRRLPHFLFVSPCIEPNRGLGSPELKKASATKFT